MQLGRIKMDCINFDKWQLMKTTAEILNFIFYASLENFYTNLIQAIAELLTTVHYFCTIFGCSVKTCFLYISNGISKKNS